MRSLVRRVIPDRARGIVRAAIDDLPYRLRDLPADLVERIRPGSALPVPPAHLRARVAVNSSRAEFLRIGRTCAADLVGAFTSERDGREEYPRCLDFGSGCGRIARHLLSSPGVASFTGVDVDGRQIGWAAEHLPGSWRTSSAEPPLPFPARSFDVVVCVSVFTHLPENGQFSWLAELERLLRPGGLLLASTSGPKLAEHLPGGFAVPAAAVEEKGFVHVPSGRGFNHQASFHSVSYLREKWSAFLKLRRFLASGLAGYQDLSVWAA